MPKTLALALTALALSAPALTAQPDSAPQRTQPTGAQVAAARTQDTSPLITLRFPGGPLPEYVQAVKRASEGNPINVVSRGEAGDVQVPQVFLERVSARSALELVTGNYTIEDLAIRVELSIPGSFPGEPPELAVPRDAVLTAIEVALTTAASYAEPSVRFHEDTDLVILHAPPDALSAAQSAIHAISEDLARRREYTRTQASLIALNASSLAVQVEDAETQLRLQTIALERALARVSAAEKDVAKLRERTSREGETPILEPHQAEDRLAEAEAMVKEQEVERERTMRRMKALQTLLENSREYAPAIENTDPSARLAAENAALRERIAALETEPKALREEVARLRGRDGGTR